MTFQMIYSMLLYLKNSGSNQRKRKTVLIDCCLSLSGCLLQVFFLGGGGERYICV